MEFSVKTNTGKEFIVDHCSSTIFDMRAFLYIEFIGYTMVEIFNVFSKSEETSVIYGYSNDKLSKTYKDYTELGEIFVVPGTNGNIRIRLEKPIQVDILGN